MPPSPSDPPADPTRWCDLAGLGVLEAAGPDARDFLHGQLSSDVKALEPGSGHYTSYNSARGRMLMNGLAWRFPAPAADRFGVLLSADLAPTVAKRLAMFVLRSKVALSDATGQWTRIGILGSHARDGVQAALGSAPGPLEVREIGGIFAIGLPDGRIAVLAPTVRAAEIRAALADHATAAGEADWRAASIRAGIPLVCAATSDQLIAQSANWEILGGVSFGKGCYPGQEIIARMQYLGRLKERLHAFRAASAEPAPGTRVYQAGIADPAAGIVVNAVPAERGGCELLASVPSSALGGAGLRLGSADGPPLEPLTLPYAIPEPTAPRGRLA